MTQVIDAIGVETCPKCKGAHTAAKSIGIGGCDFCQGEGVTFIMEELQDRVLLGDCQRLGGMVRPRSVDMVFTDPPYLDEFRWAWEWLGEWAAKVLKPGGSLITFVGKSAISDVCRRIELGADEQLHYHWMLAAWQPDSNTRFWSKHIMVTWRPLLWYRKPPPKPGAWVPDGRRSVRDKRFHEWGQGAELVDFYIQHLTQPGDLVADPFTGGGTIPAVCKRIGRHFLGFEVDLDAYHTTHLRLDSTPPPLFTMAPEQDEQLQLWSSDAQDQQAQQD